MPEKDDLISVGKIIGTHGIKGQLKVYSFSGNIESLQAVDIITLRSPKGELREIGLKGAAHHSGKMIISLKSHDDINLVQPYIGSEICLYRSQLPPPDEDEYYWCDLLGLEVVTDSGLVLGSIADIFATGSSDVYVVKSGEKEYLIPAIADVISSVDLKGGRIVITPLEGLLDL